jgi:hypothetical protein
MFHGLWKRLLGRGEPSGVDRASPEGRRLTAESLEDRQADEHAGEWLGGINPNRLLPGDAPPRDD